jgi:hypothetical protein
VFRLLGVEQRWFGLGPLGGGLAAGSGFRAGNLGAGTLDGSGSNLLGCLLLLLVIILWILLRRIGAGRYSEYTSKILLRQRVELERKTWRS